MSDNITLRSIWNIVLKKWLTIAILAILGGAAMFGYTKFFVSQTYSASTLLYVNNLEQGQEATKLTINDYTAAQSIVNTYCVILRDNAIMRQAAEKLNEEYNYHISGGALSGMIGLAAADQTEVLKISAVSTDPQLAAAACNVMADIADTTLRDVIQATSVKQISKATAPTSPTGPNTKRNALIGALAGAAIGVAIALALYFFDDTIKGEEEFNARFSVPVLGEIPTIEVTGKKKGKKANA